MFAPARIAPMLLAVCLLTPACAHEPNHYNQGAMQPAAVTEDCLVIAKHHEHSPLGDGLGAGLGTGVPLASGGYGLSLNINVQGQLLEAFLLEDVQQGGNPWRHAHAGAVWPLGVYEACLSDALAGGADADFLTVTAPAAGVAIDARTVDLVQKGINAQADWIAATRATPDTTVAWLVGDAHTPAVAETTPGSGRAPLAVAVGEDIDLLADRAAASGYAGSFEVDALNPAGDYNHDGRVDSLDYAMWRENVGRGAGAPASGPHAGAVVGALDVESWTADHQVGAAPQANAKPGPSAVGAL